MTMRKIKSKERKNGMRYCTFCKPARVPAIYRNTAVPIHKHVELACEEHKSKLTIHPPRPVVAVPKNTRDDHYTEADYQTWMRL